MSLQEQLDRINKTRNSNVFEKPYFENKKVLLRLKYLRTIKNKFNAHSHMFNVIEIFASNFEKNIIFLSDYDLKNLNKVAENVYGDLVVYVSSNKLKDGYRLVFTKAEKNIVNDIKTGAINDKNKYQPIEKELKDTDKKQEKEHDWLDTVKEINV